MEQGTVAAILALAAVITVTLIVTLKERRSDLAIARVLASREKDEPVGPSDHRSSSSRPPRSAQGARIAVIVAGTVIGVVLGCLGIGLINVWFEPLVLALAPILVGVVLVVAAICVGSGWSDSSEAVGALYRRVIITAVVSGLAGFAAGISLIMYLGRTPLSVEDYLRTCDRTRSFAGAAPYLGPGPHPIVISGFAFSEHDPKPDDAFVWDPTDPSAVQLIACGGDRIDDGEFIARCDYTYPRGFGGVEIELYRGLFRYEIYEAGTGSRIGAVEVQGDADYFTDDVGSKCPEMIWHDPGDPIKYANPDVVELRDAFDPFVLASRPR